MQQPASGFRPMQISPLTSNSWTDNLARPGSTYYYSVSARDMSNNESGRSATIQVEVPTGNEQIPHTNG